MVSLQSNTALAKATSCSSFLCVPGLVYLLPVTDAGNKIAQMSPRAYHFCVCHVCGAKTALRTKFPKFCPQFPFLLCSISGILECLLNPSWVRRCKPMARSSSACIVAAITVLFYFSFIES